MELFVNQTTGAATLIVTNSAVTAWLTTTLLIFVVLPGIAGVFVGKDWISPAFNWWGRWCVLGPLNVIRVVIHAIAVAVVSATSVHWEAEKPLGRMLAFGANFAVGLICLVANVIVAVTSLGGAPRATRGASAHH